MTNEELAAAIQSGETERMAELWAGVENLVKWKANRILSALSAPIGVEFDDLCNVGYIALTKAVPTYKTDSGAFSTWFMFYLQTAFAEATGYRTGKQKRDPLHTALSLDAPLQDADGLTLADSLAADTDMETEVLTAIRQSELRRELESILQQIGGIGAQVMRLRYFENMPYERIAAALHISIGVYISPLKDNTNIIELSNENGNTLNMSVSCFADGARQYLDDGLVAVFTKSTESDYSMYIDKIFDGKSRPAGMYSGTFEFTIKIEERK